MGTGARRRATGGRGAPTVRALAVALAAVLLAGCTVLGSSGSPSVSPSRTPAAPSPVPTAVTGPLARYYDQRLDWQDCGFGGECAKLTVPIDYRQPGGGTFRLAVVRYPARDQGQRIGALVVNPGGPGVSGVAYAQQARDSIGPILADRLDVVGFDPRGVAASVPVRCLDGATLSRVLDAPADPQSPAQVAEVAADARTFAAGCRARSAALLPHVSTLDTARDLDVLRSALGEPRLTYLGKSYGTLLGAVYAQLFPDRVRALVLDGGVDPSLTDERLSREQAVGFEQSVDRFLAWCVEQQRCPGPVDQAKADLTAMLAAADRGGLPAPLAGGGRRLSGAAARNAIALAQYVPDQLWLRLSTGVRQAEGGDGSILLRMSDALVGRQSNGAYTNQVEAGTAISCLDRPHATTTAAFDTAARSADQVAPWFGAFVTWGTLPCASWPVPAASRPGPLRAAGAPPILVIGTTGDPATPYRWSQALASGLASGRLLTADGIGHTAFGRGSTCVDQAVQLYLLSLVVPAAGTVCPGPTGP